MDIEKNLETRNHNSWQTPEDMDKSTFKICKPQPVYPNKFGYLQRMPPMPKNLPQPSGSSPSDLQQVPMMAALPATTMVKIPQGIPSNSPSFSSNLPGVMALPPMMSRMGPSRHMMSLDGRAPPGISYIPHYVITPKFPSGKKLFRCPQCRYITDRKNNLKRHIGTMHQDCGKVLECCEIIFPSKASLRDHVVLFHRSGYKCRYCGRNFCRKALLKRHLVVHNGQKEYICTICDYGTSDQEHMNEHKKMHQMKIQLGEDKLEKTQGQQNGDQREYNLQNMRWNWLGMDMHGESWMKSYAHQMTCASKHQSSLFPDRLRSTYNKDPNEGKVVLNQDKVDLSSKMKPSSMDTTEAVKEPKSHFSASSSITNAPEKSRHGPPRLCVYPYKCSNCARTFLLQSKLLEHAHACRIHHAEPCRPLKFFQDSTLSKCNSRDHDQQGDDPECMDTLAYMKSLVNQHQYDFEDDSSSGEVLDLSMSSGRAERQTEEKKGQAWNKEDTCML